MKQRSHRANSAAHVNLRMESWHRRALYTAVVALTASGILWLLGHYFLRSAGEFGPASHPLEPWSMKLHGAAVLATTFFAGSVMNSHIRRAWRAACNRTAGCLLITALALLTITGYCLWYVAGESSREVWSIMHWVLGLAFPLLLSWHIFRGRRARRQQAAR
jgi:cation transport ATPase